MTEKKRTGRPPYVPTQKERDQVRVLSAMGVPDVDVARVMQISAPTLRKYFRSELAVGHIESTAKVAESLFKQATNPVKPNVVAAIFWLKCRAGWRENAAGTPQDQDPAPVGKKAATDAAARTVHKGTGWERLLDTPASGRVQ
jgi:hypothetical protein